MPNEHRTVIVGFDALDFRYLDAFESSLPNFRALRQEGVEAPLESTFPPWTGSAWPSMYTGTDPSHHGTYGFFHHTANYPDEDELDTRNHVGQPALWNYLSAQDQPAVVLNVPVTHPAEPIEGVLVPGYLAHEDADGHPDGVREEISEAIGEPYRIYSPEEADGHGDEKRESYLDLIRMRGRAAEYLLDAYDWQVAVVQVQKTDTVFHDFDDRETFRRTYERADEVLGRVRDVAGDANVVVCSDHGIGPVDGYNVYLNERLRNGGFLETGTDSSSPNLMEEKPGLVGEESDDGDDDGHSLAGRAAASAAGALDRVGIAPGDVYALTRKLGIDGVVTSVVPTEAMLAADEGVDWADSRAYCRSAELGVRVNLEGREPDGVVPPEEYEAVRDDLVELLETMRTPDGDPVFEWVRRREAVYDGPYAEHACDVLFMPAEMDHIVKSSFVGRELTPTDHTHDHKRTGVFLASGPAFEDADPGALSLTDVAPVAMAASGLDVPARMTGTVPDELLARPVSRAEYGDVPFGDDLTNEGDGTADDGSVEERLSNLGYI